MRFFLDGKDWQAGYFCAEGGQNANPTQINNMLMDTAASSGFLSMDSAPEGVFSATIPGCDRSVLLENGEIDDPYYGRNMERSRWSEHAEWAFRKEFTLPKEWQNCKSVRLIFRCASYQAKVYLNCDYLGEGQGMFAPWEYDVSLSINRTGKNILVVIFAPAPQACPNHEHTKPAEFAYYRHCQMSFGWDWARPLVPTGIFDHVELIGSENARVRDCAFRTQGRHVHLDLEFGTLEDATVPLSMDLLPKNHDGQPLHLERAFTVRAGEVTHAEWEFDFNEARLWFPNGYGEQPLYDLLLTLPGSEWRRQVGFRDILMKRNPGSPEDAYPLTFTINGVEIFARGGNWVPADMIFSRLDAALYEREVRLAKEAGFNIFRVWGGGLIEKEEFYDACDRHGIMVWQEFPHSCSQYPTDPRTLALRKRDGEAIIRKLRNHVSMSLYCGGNEMLYYGEIPDNPIYLQYQVQVARLAPGMPYHIASPDLSRPGERNHGPWRLMEHSFWNSHKRLLASELGCPGWAELDSIEQFIPSNDPCPNGQHWKYHFTLDGPGRPLKPLLDDFQPPVNDRRRMCDATMFAQAAQLGYVMEHYRSLVPFASGCFIWQYNESWPTNSYSVIDFYTRPKPSYYRLARDNQPVILFLEDDSWHIKDGAFKGNLKLVCDRTLQGKATITLMAIDMTGKKLFCDAFESNCTAGCTELGTIEKQIPPVPNNLVFVKFKVSLNDTILFDNERLFGAPDFSKVFSVPETQLAFTQNLTALSDGENLLEVKVTNVGSTPALFVRSDLPEAPLFNVYWLDNYRSIMPSETITFKAKITAGTKPPKITLRGWNCKA